MVWYFLLKTQFSRPAICFCRIEHEETFLDLMKQKFLSGQDTSVNYGSIDADTLLDDHFARLEQQNAEDAYFESSD
jgi:hypothetical protein